MFSNNSKVLDLAATVVDLPMDPEDSHLQMPPPPQLLPQEEVSHQE